MLFNKPFALCNNVPRTPVIYISNTKKDGSLDIANEHNLSMPRGLPRPYGIRVTLNKEDPFRNLVDEGWEKFHWYVAEEERDVAFEDMRGEHRYSRHGDRPSLIFEKVEKSA